MYKLAVFGNPIEHSLSPVVFKIFATMCGVDLDYERILALNEEDFNQKVLKFFAGGGMAVNVTSPFKNAAAKIADVATAKTKFCAGASFLRKTGNGKIIADTADGYGLVCDLVGNKKIDLYKKNILILGSGFVLESIILDLLGQNPMQLDVLARNQERCSYLEGKFGIGKFAAKKDYDLIINSIPSGKGQEIFSQLTNLRDDTVGYDLTYTKSDFIAFLKMQNPTMHLYNGLGMLVEQARYAFTELFKGVPDSVQAIKQITEMLDV